MEKMTKKQAIAECKELWEAIEKSGLSKYDFLNTEEGKIYGDRAYEADCPLCTYTSQCPPPVSDDDCEHCPLVTKYNKGCYNLGFLTHAQASEEFFAAVRGL